jgi:hypothetical protein
MIKEEKERNDTKTTEDRDLVDATNGDAEELA